MPFEKGRGTGAPIAPLACALLGRVGGPLAKSVCGLLFWTFGLLAAKTLSAIDNITQLGICKTCGHPLERFRKHHICNEDECTDRSAM